MSKLKQSKDKKKDKDKEFVEKIKTVSISSKATPTRNKEITMQFKYIGLIKKNSQLSKVLVQSQEGKYYVWTSEHKNIDMFCSAGGTGEIPINELELANQRQIDIGRDNLWHPNQSNIMTKVVFMGVISGGKKNKSVLVMRGDCVDYGEVTSLFSLSLLSLFNSFSICVVSAVLIDGLSMGSVISVDRRFLSPAREDHIKAGLGLGKLQRRKRVSVS